MPNKGKQSQPSAAGTVKRWCVCQPLLPALAHMKEAIIRGVAEGDAEGLHYFMVDLIAEQLSTIHYRAKAPSIEEEREFVRYLKSNGVGFIALTEGMVVGFLDFNSTSKSFGMSVARKYRRRGIGAALLNTLIRWANQSEFDRLELEVFENNLDAIRLYQCFGFTITGRKKDAAISKGRNVDTLLMSREVANVG